MPALSVSSFIIYCTWGPIYSKARKSLYTGSRSSLRTTTCILHAIHNCGCLRCLMEFSADETETCQVKCLCFPPSIFFFFFLASASSEAPQQGGIQNICKAHGFINVQYCCGKAIPLHYKWNPKAPFSPNAFYTGALMMHYKNIFTSFSKYAYERFCIAKSA